MQDNTKRAVTEHRYNHL